MKLLLTTSRKTSLRVRQFIKEFSLLFPKGFIQKTNRGKRSIEELFNESIYKYDRILLVTNKHGNPNRIIGYIKLEDGGFSWCFEFKIRYVKLSYEFDYTNLQNPIYTEILFENIDPDLESVLKPFFEPITGKQKKIRDEQVLQLQFKHMNNGFKIQSMDSEQIQIPPEIVIDEILIQDPMLNEED